MRNKSFILIGATLGAIGGGLVGVVLLYQATQTAPDFYGLANDTDVERCRRASDEMERRSIALHNQVRKRGSWAATFTGGQINGWLAVDLAEKFPELAAGRVQDPRIAFREGYIDVGFRLRETGMTAIVSVEIGAELVAPNVVACRLYHARAGSVPIPLKTVLDEITQAARRWRLPIRWAQDDGDPVAVVTIPGRRDADARQQKLEVLALLDGEIYVAGRTE